MCSNVVSQILTKLLPVPNFIGVVFHQAYEEATTSEAFKKGRAVSEEVCF